MKRLLLAIVVLSVLSAPVVAQDVGTRAEPRLDLYEYDAQQPLNAELAPYEETDEWTVHHVLFDSTNEQRVPALISTPKVGEAPYPLIMVQHGLSDNKDVDYAKMVARGLATQGYATIRMDAQYHGERARPEDEGKFWERLYDLIGGGGWVQSIVDMRRALDYAATREDIDMERIGYIGMSMGAMMGTVTSGVDERIDAAVLIVGGAMGPEPDAQAAHIDPANYIDLISPRPVLMLNGKNDPIVLPPWTERLYEAAQDPKRIVWYDTEHTVPPQEAAQEIAAFMQEHVMGGEH